MFFGLLIERRLASTPSAWCFDITEKMQAQDALQAAQAELASSAQVSRMGAMTASIAHEMNQPLTAVVNRIQLQQVLFNLVTNAIEAMESVADRTLLVKSEHESSGQVRVTVEDSGNGIDPQHVEKIFGSFFTTKVDGIGMSLSICRSIIESHGGRLWASSGRSSGAVFQFTLPSNQSQGETDAVIESRD
jgi:C4-dicarboxylate-specific signal transduction histidine kinase